MIINFSEKKKISGDAFLAIESVSKGFWTKYDNDPRATDVQNAFNLLRELHQTNRQWVF